MAGWTIQSRKTRAVNFEKTSLEGTTLEENDSNIATCPAALLPTITPILGYILMIFLLLIAKNGNVTLEFIFIYPLHDRHRKPGFPQSR